MSYRVTLNGVTVAMDTPEEVYKLLKSSPANGATMAAIEGSATCQEWDEDSFGRLIMALPKGSLQLRAISALYHANMDEGLSREEMLKALRVTDPKQVGGVFSGLAKNSKKLGLPSPLEIERTRDQTGQRSYRYKLRPSFKEALKNADQKRNAGRDLPELREYICSQRAALAGFMEQGASLRLEGNDLMLRPGSEIYVRYLTDNLGVIAELASKHYGRPINARLEPPTNIEAESPTNE